MNKIVVIGDLVSSKKLSNRDIVQEKLVDVLKQLNTNKNNLASPYTITLGDEFQAVFSRADRIFHDAIVILSSMYPVQIRFSFGIGTIDTPINPKQAIGMDGPAFYNARLGIEGLKTNQHLFDITGLDSSSLGVSRKSLYLISHICRKWNDTRLHVLLGLYQKSPVKDISAGVKQTEQAIYKAIESGALRIIVQLLEEITSAINTDMEKK